MNTTKTFFLKGGFLFLITLYPIIHFNYFIDPYGVFGRDVTRSRTSPNLRHVKMEYLQRNPLKYDSFVFGSSRVWDVNVKKISPGRFYNMGYPMGLPSEHLEDLRWMIRFGLPIREVVVGVDEISYLTDPEVNRQRALTRSHPLGRDRVSWMMEYLFFIPNKELLDELFGEKKGYEYFYDCYDSGRVLYTEHEAFIVSNMEKHLQSPEFSVFSDVELENLLKKSREDRIPQVIAEITALVNFCHEQKISFKVFINPIHAKRYHTLDRNVFNEFLLKLSQVSDFYDFSGINEVTQNCANYYDYRHYRELVGDKIIARLFNGEKESEMGFGVLVRQDQVESHLKKIHPVGENGKWVYPPQ